MVDPLDPADYPRYQRAVTIASASALLSLDCVRAFYAEMGLDKVDSGAFAAALRQAIVAFRARMESSGEATLDFEDTLLEEMATQRGDAELGQLRTFLEHRYHEAHSELPHWSSWLRAFHHCAYGRGKHDALALPLDRRNTAIEEFREVTDIGELEAQMQSFARAPQSDWDVEIFVRRGWDPANEDGMPFGVVREIIVLQRFQSFAQRLLAQLNDSERQRVHTATAAVVNALGTWLPDPLKGLPELLESMSC